MANEIKPSKTGSKGSVSVDVELAAVQGDYTNRKVLTICLTIILSILCCAIVLAIYKDDKPDRDYVGKLLPVITGAVTALAGFLAGQRARK